MKFLHAADLHLDSPLRGLSRRVEAPVEDLRDATRAAFNNLVELAIEEEVAFVLLAGDLYDGTCKDCSTALFLKKKIGELERANIRVFGVLGNHDAQSKLTEALERPKNLTLFHSSMPQTEVLRDLEVAIHGQSFDKRHVDKNLAAGFPAATPGLFNIGLLHTSLNGREGHADYAPCSSDDLRRRDYQYWALGHVHAREEVSRDPWMVFPGCLQGRHARETGPKGCSLVTVEDGRVDSIEHRVLDVVRWAKTEVDLRTVNSMQDVLDSARKGLSEVPDGAEDRIVATRLRFVGTSPIHPELLVKSQWLRQELRELAAELHGDRVWIEKVEIATTGKPDRGAVLADDGPFRRLAKEILGVGEESSAVRGLDAALEAFRNKLPSEVFLAAEGLRLDDQEVVERLVQEAKEILLGKLVAAMG